MDVRKSPIFNYSLQEVQCRLDKVYPILKGVCGLTKSLQTVTAAMELKDTCSLEGKL